MDFQTFVNSFRKNVLNEGDGKLDELTSQSRNIVRKYIADGTPGREGSPYSFSNLFKDSKDMRVAIPLEDQVASEAKAMFKRLVQDLGWEPVFEEKQITQKKRRLADEGGEEYTVEVDALVTNMKKKETRTIPKGPRAGETIEREVETSLGKLIQKEGTPEEKEWWSKHQNTLREKENVLNWFVRPYRNDFEQVEVRRPVIIISRHPIDVARMSDFTATRSCHAEGRMYFNCAIQEAKGHGMVAYLVKAEDFDRYDLKDRLQAEEIFGDSDVGIEGPEPIGRVRIRKLFNKADEEGEFAVAEKRTYGRTVPDFLPTVNKWLRDGQKEYWLDSDGDFDVDIINDQDWIVVGGEYMDNTAESLLVAMFDDTEYEEQAEGWENSSFEYEDIFDEGENTAYQEAERRVNELQRYYGEQAGAKHVNIHIDIEEGWDETMPFAINTFMNMDFSFEVPEEWAESEGFVEIPSWSDGWSARRDLNQEIEAIIYRVAYLPDNAEVEVLRSDETSDDFSVDVRASYATTDVNQAESQCEEYLELDSKYNELKAAMAIYFSSEGYLPSSGIQKALETLDDLTFDNIDVIYDKDKPQEGILIRNKDREKIIVGNYPVVDPRTGLEVYKKFVRNLRFPPGRDAALAVDAKIRSAMKKIQRKADRAAKNQLTFPGMKPAEKKDFFVPQGLSFAFDPEKLPQRYASPGRSFSQKSPEEVDRINRQLKPEVGYHFGLEVDANKTEDEIMQIIRFAEYLDDNIGQITDVIRKQVDDTWRKSADEVKEEAKSEAEEKQELGARLQAQAQAAFTRDRLREMIKKTIKKKLMEQAGFETRLFQVNLRLSIDKGQGGGIEQKLNRIRAIDGVTVVSHEEGGSIGGRETIEAKVKFHPESDSLRAEKYIYQVLVPAINSSRHVPGVKVIEIVPRTLKRLDK